MDISDLLMIGVGQCGNNIGCEFESHGYNNLCINTSELDIAGVDVEHKFIIPGASGCAKDRKRAISYFGRNHNKIFSLVENNFPKQRIVFVIFALGGGTGAGIGPILLDSLSRKYYDRKFGAIVVAPAVDESIQCKINAVETYNQLIKIPNLRSVFILDNNSMKNKIDINTKFVKLFDSVMKMNKPNKKGVIDNYELEVLLTTQGSSLIMDFNSNNLKEVGSWQSIFLEHEKGCKFIGASTVGDVDLSTLENEFGKPDDIYRGYNDNSNTVIVTGMPYSMSYFKAFDKEIQEYKSKKDSRLITDTIDTSGYGDVQLDIDIVKDFDFDKLLNNYNQ